MSQCRGQASSADDRASKVCSSVVDAPPANFDPSAVRQTFSCGTGHRVALLFLAACWTTPRRAYAEVLMVQTPTDEVPRECEAIGANWNQAIEDGGGGALSGDVFFKMNNPCGCLPYMADDVRGRLVLIDTAELCDHPAQTVERAALGGARGVVFFYHTDGLGGIALGNHRQPSIRAVMIARAHGEAIQQGLEDGIVTVKLVAGRLISEDAYEEQFIFRADEVSSTRAVNFLWHTYPEMLPSSDRPPLSLRLMRDGVSIPRGWFSRQPSFVPLFNPSLLALDDGSLLATVRMSNGPGCPSVRRSGESSMDTRVFRNELVLVHIAGGSLDVSSHVVVETPELVCRFTKNTKVSGRQFLDEVRGPMDARLATGTDGRRWVSFYAERNLEGEEIVRGIHAAPLHMAWRPCGDGGGGGGFGEGGSGGPDGKWQLVSDSGAWAGPGCRWIGSGNPRSDLDCRTSCETLWKCNAVSFRNGHCELRLCKGHFAPIPLRGWQAWSYIRSPPRSDAPHWHSTDRACGWSTFGNGTSLSACQASCESTSDKCDAVLFSLDHSRCILQRCDDDVIDSPILPGWSAWRLSQPAFTRRPQCLDRAWIDPDELVAFPVGDGVEKNWNLIRAEAGRMFIEYHVDPHIVLEVWIADKPLAQGLQLQYFGTAFVARWPYSVLHGVTNVRGGFCCAEVPRRLLPPWLLDAGSPEGGPLLLGCGHLQRIRSPYDQAPGDVGRFRRQAKSRTYHQFFYGLRASEPFDVVAVSHEWCIAANGHFSWPWRSQLAADEVACEAIQFAAGLALSGDDTLVVSYGINDCEADLLALPLARVLAMLRPVRSEVNASLDDVEMI